MILKLFIVITIGLMITSLGLGRINTFWFKEGIDWISEKIIRERIRTPKPCYTAVYYTTEDQGPIFLAWQLDNDCLAKINGYDGDFKIRTMKPEDWIYL